MGVYTGVHGRQIPLCPTFCSSAFTTPACASLCPRSRTTSERTCRLPCALTGKLCQEQAVEQHCLSAQHSAAELHLIQPGPAFVLWDGILMCHASDIWEDALAAGAGATVSGLLCRQSGLVSSQDIENLECYNVIANPKYFFNLKIALVDSYYFDYQVCDSALPAHAGQHSLAAANPPTIACLQSCAPAGYWSSH